MKKGQKLYVDTVSMAQTATPAPDASEPAETAPAPAGKYTERPAVALKEIGVRPAWRKTGTARRIHDALLATRDEPFVTLMVNPAAGDGKVHALYTSWGYEDIGQSQPSPASPVLTVMIRDTH